MTKPKILLDCDTGIDDAIALLYLASLLDSHQADLVGVGTVHGNVAPDVGAINTLRVFEVAGVDIPVAVGAARPMAQQVEYAHAYHGGDGLGGAAQGTPRGKLADISAPEQIVRLARANPGELTILAIGPLTNLAIALLIEPSLPELVREVIIMGGALDHPGNITSHAEANIWHDPEAAELVLAENWPVTLVPLDATHTTAMAADWLDKLAAGETAIARFASQVLEFYVQAYERILGTRGCVIHDALAAMVVVDPAICRYRERAVQVELRGQVSRGATLWDARRSAQDNGRPTVRVATECDVATFQDRLLASLLR